MTAASDSLNEADFLARLRDRDEDAVRRLVRAYLPQLVRTARGAGLEVHDAEDAAQETLITLVERIGTFEGRSQVRTWLFGILYRKISEQRRSVRRSHTQDDIDEVMESRFRTDGFWAAPPASCDTEVYRREVRLHLADCLDGVTTQQRMAFVMREVEDLDSDEICAALEVSRSNLGVLLFRGRNTLRECLEKRSIEGLES